MKYAVHYSRALKYDKNADEFIIYFNIKDNTLPQFLELYQDKTIIMIVNHILTKNEIVLLKGLKEKFSNFKLLYETQVLDVPAELKHIPHFFKRVCNNWRDLNTILCFEPSDVYIGGELGFLLKDVRSKVSCNIRVIPNLVAEPVTNNMDKEQAFFIRPEDIWLYEEIIDVIEFFCEKPHEESAIADIYINSKTFKFDLRKLIYGLSTSIDNSNLSEGWGINRILCGGKCWRLYECCVCHKAASVSNALASRYGTKI